MRAREPSNKPLSTVHNPKPTNPKTPKPENPQPWNPKTLDPPRCLAANLHGNPEPGAAWRGSRVSVGKGTSGHRA